MNKAFDKAGKYARNEARPTGAGNTDEPLDINQTLGGPVMPIDGNISASGDSASVDEKSTWKSIGDLARKLAEEAGCQEADRKKRAESHLSKGLSQIATAREEVAIGWIEIGTAMCSAEEMFEAKADFNRWFASQDFKHRGKRLTIKARDAAMWAARNQTAFFEGIRCGHGDTPQAAFKWWMRITRCDPRDYIYVMVNPIMPDLVKVGMTKCDPDVRAKQLSESSGVPVPFVVSATFRSSKAKAAEALTHKFLRDQRVSASREFFKVSELHACKAIAAAIEEVEAK